MTCGTYSRKVSQTSDGLQPPFGHPPSSPSSSSIDWLAPARISFSQDFARPGSHSLPHETMKEISEISDSPARLSSSKSSPSEFEFSMSIPGHDSPYEHTMLAADELFCDGKLLPLYTTSSQGVSTEPNTGGQGRSSAEGHIKHRYPEDVTEMAKVKIDQNPISPKAPSCTSRWKELLGLKKVQIQDVKDLTNGGKQHKKSLYSTNTVIPGRRSLDSVKDSHGDAHLRHINKNARHSVSHSESHSHHGGHMIQAQNRANQMPCDPLLSVANPDLCSTANRQAWRMDRAMSGSQSMSKTSEDSEGTTTKANGEAVLKHRHSASREQSPTKQREEGRASCAVMSPRRGGGSRGGPRGVSPGRPSVVSRATESSRNAIATRLVVRRLDRSYSSPKPLKKRQEHLRSGRQRSTTDGSRSLEKSPSYSAGVRVSPVINVPLYITPGLTKGSKKGIFGLTHFFSSKKDKTLDKLSSAAIDHQQHHHHTHNAEN